MVDKIQGKIIVDMSSSCLQFNYGPTRRVRLAYSCYISVKVLCAGDCAHVIATIIYTVLYAKLFSLLLVREYPIHQQYC